MTRNDFCASGKKMIWRVGEDRETGQGDIGKECVPVLQGTASYEKELNF